MLIAYIATASGGAFTILSYQPGCVIVPVLTFGLMCLCFLGFTYFSANDDTDSENAIKFGGGCIVTLFVLSIIAMSSLDTDIAKGFAGRDSMPNDFFNKMTIS